MRDRKVVESWEVYHVRSGMRRQGMGQGGVHGLLAGLSGDPWPRGGCPGTNGWPEGEAVLQDASFTTC